METGGWGALGASLLRVSGLSIAVAVWGEGAHSTDAGGSVWCCREERGEKSVVYHRVLRERQRKLRCMRSL